MLIKKHRENLSSVFSLVDSVYVSLFLLDLYGERVSELRKFRKWSLCVPHMESHNPQIQGSEQLCSKENFLVLLILVFPKCTWPENYVSNNLSKHPKDLVFHRKFFIECYSELSKYSNVYNKLFCRLLTFSAQISEAKSNSTL